MEKIYPSKNDTGTIGTSDKAWQRGYFSDVSIGGVDYTWPTADGSANQVIATDGSGTLAWTSAGAATAWDDIADPDGAGTIAFTTLAQTITSTKTDGDMLLIQGLGAFGDVSVVRIEQKTGNPTDGTVLEVVAADANVDPLVISSSSQANALVVGQGAGTVAIAAAATVGGTLAVTGASTLTGLVTATAGVVCGDSLTKTATVEITNAQIKTLRASPKELVAAPGADKMIEFVSAVIIMDYGSNVLSESSDNLVIQYNTSGLDASAAIETTGFLDASNDAIAVVGAADIAGAAATSYVDKALELFNSGDGEIGGNAAADTTLTVIVTYRVHTVGLA